ncbi:RNA-directed DNA polymerase, eukaryota, partial [Tanacetum coccineum]
FTPKDTNEETEERPNTSNESKRVSGDGVHSFQEEDIVSGVKKHGSKKKAKDDVVESMCYGHFQKSETPRSGGSILQLMDDMVKELTEKRLLWDYLSLVMENWNGEVIIMGDFNEVRKKAERFGSVFNVQGADAFNMFISNAGLEEVPLGGCSFTWCHKSANKMSKLDLFLISESLLSLCPNISVVSLDRYLSDHRSILMRESYYDYGHVPFRFFHYWFDMEGFDKLVEESWKAAPVADTIAIIKMMKKLKYLKENIHKGEGDEDVVNKRANVDRSLQELEKLQSVEVAQKAKIKWAIKGDENSKYYHADLECEVTKDEIKRAVWDCGTDKSRGPDGFTFDFYRRYWKIIESDVVDATHDANKVKDFRPISLIGSLYKIIAKLLANRLVVVLVYTSRFKEWWMQNESNINNIVHVLDCFHRASGLRINMSKSKLLGISVDADKVDQAARKIVPIKVLQRLESIRAYFFNGVELGSKKPIWVKWNNVLSSKHKDPREGVEKTQFDSMLEKVEGTLLADMRDRWTWSLEGSGDFSVASVRKLLDGNMLLEVASKTRGMEIESIICPMCGEAVEYSRHIFFSCHIAREILRKISRWWDVSYMELSSYGEWLDWILNIRISVKHKQILEGVFYAMWWPIWNFRNKCIFDSENPSKASIFEDVVSRSFYWCR